MRHVELQDLHTFAMKYKQQMTDIVDALDNGLVTWEQINAIQIGKPFNEIDGIVSIRVPSHDASVINLIVIMGPGSRFLLHEHDCLEIGVLTNGEVEVNGSILGTYDSFRFEPGELHKLFSRFGCTIFVSFTRPRLMKGYYPAVAGVNTD